MNLFIFRLIPKPTQVRFGIFGNKASKGYATEATFQTKPYKLHRLDSGPSIEVKTNKDEVIKLFTKMQTIRRMEAAANNMYKEKLIRGFCHLYTGQEACAVGMDAAMRNTDAVITAYRAHGWVYLRGATIAQVLSELTGKYTGCAKGKGGSMHMYVENFYGGNGIVGAQIPLGAGVALAQKYNGTDSVTFALYGDGAANQGQLFEAFNMAKLWSLPVIFVCENNGFGMGTSAERAAANTNYYTRGDVIPGIWVDGMDVLAVKEAARFCVERCRKGEGPILLETATYRYHGHSMSDPGTSYRTRDEIQEVRQTRDPITSFRDKIIEAGLTNNEELKKIEQTIREQVEAAVKVAKTESDPPMDDIYADVYVESVEPRIRGVAPFDFTPHKRVGKPFNLRQ
uniref:Pyruvate dehydrogenase E1 component subunit alpha n=1 Tax=Hemiscolopendra marginata TaxID=943146 RepID=A0A646QD52_9MYRI